MFGEFRTFLTKSNALALAIGVILAVALGAVVSSLVTDIIMPPIGLLLGGVDFSNFYIDLSGQSYESLEAARAAGAPVIAYGVFINAVIKFLIVAWAVFLLVKQVNRFYRKPDVAPAPPSNQEILLAEIRDLLKRR